MFSRTKKIMVIVIALTCVAATTSQANATIFWLWNRLTRPACGPSYCAPAPRCNTTCVQRVCRYVPQTCYRNVCVNVPVTTYRPYTTCDPCTGCQKTCYRRVTSYVRQVRRVPYTSYRQVIQYVNYRRPTSCCPTNACGTNCATGSCATGNCVTGNCATGNCGTGIVPTTPQGQGMERPRLKPENKEPSAEKKSAAIVQPLHKTVQPIKDNSTQNGPELQLNPARSPRIHRPNGGNKTAAAPKVQTLNYTTVAWTQPTEKPAVAMKPVSNNERNTSGWVVSQD